MIFSCNKRGMIGPAAVRELVASEPRQSQNENRFSKWEPSDLEMRDYLRLLA